MGRRIFYVLAVFLVAALLAGCAPAAAPAAPAAPKAPAPAAPVAPAAPKPAAPAAAAPKEKTIIKLMAASVGGSGWNWFTANAFLAAKHSAWLRCDVLPSKGLAEALRFMLEGKSEVASTSGFLMTRAIKGIDEYKDLGPRPDLRLVYNLSATFLNVMVLDKSPVKAFTYDDLKGKTVSMLQVGSQTVDVAFGYLKAVGLDPKKDVRILHMKAADATSALLDGTADVCIIMPGIPYAPIEEMFASKPSRLIPIPAELTKKTNEIAGLGLVVTTFPANLYKGQKEPVLSSSISMAAVSRDGVKEDIVYELTRLWWDYMDERNELHAEIAKQATVDNLKSVAASTGVEYHKGALKYYREKGWVK